MYGIIDGIQRGIINSVVQQGAGLKHTKVLKDGNTVAWFDFLDLSTITKDGSNLVAQVNDKLASDVYLYSTTNKPVWDVNGILFDGVNDFLRTLQIVFPQPNFVYIVFEQVSWKQGGYIFTGVGSSTAGTLVQDGVSPQIDAYAGTFSAKSSAMPVGNWGIARVCFNGANSFLQINETPKITGNFGSTAMNGLFLGSYAGSAQFGNIKVKEVILRKSADTDSDQAILYRYLKNKYTLGTYNLIFDGDSLTAGSGSSGGLNYPKQVANNFFNTNNITVDVHAFGVPGQTLTQMESDAVTQIDSLRDATHDTLIAWGGVNDLGLELATTKETIYARYKTYCTNRKTAGWKVFALTMLPQGYYTRATYEADRLWFNEQVRNDLSLIVDGIVDITTDPRIGDVTDWQDLTYFTADKIHLNNVGYGIVAEMVANAIRNTVILNRIL